MKMQKIQNLKSSFADYLELTKPGVTFMVIISTLGGFYLASARSLDLVLLFNTLLGSWLVASGTNALNQLIERDIDSLMKRTKRRPLPAGRISVVQAGLFSVTISLLGILELFLAVNPTTGLLAALTLVSYIFLYTPLKRKTPLSTIVGAVPGALPAMGGWTAVRGTVEVEAWVLFAILFFWQLPHFLAIAWIYRDDYRRGGFSVLTVLDKNGIHTGIHIVVTCLALLSVSLLPTILGLTGTLYLVGALVLGIAFFTVGIKTAMERTNRCARYLLHASIVYLPILMSLMFLDKAR
ncbi:MAG: protoheme IX farnesyltransferase [Calditrichaeota bacterium]|nr:MAG: protoheme IX farnesyltransferase [Calditrichota bacterium]